ncbi:sugar ABC transporter permease [Paenibacillus antri]|uniref:Sugar ABC transporter permease n=2 Tax=Paenibacillus antri TaxID=2582848 RepID=A0A5R9GA42_9BACL|nr:ABC transporter permease subunit [Paenibacillus antri]TLS50950.1 sugar ABC transporter permease [Paenibacillus antri]
MDDLKALYEFRKYKVLYAMFLPIVIYFLIFAYLPMTGIVLAFKEYNYQGGIWGSPWAGWSNFEYFFKSGKAWIVTKNTVAYNVVFLALYTFFSIAVAIFIAEMRGKWFKKTAQSFMLLPYFISWVIVGAFVYNLFNYEFGVVNSVIEWFGGDPVDIYGTPSYWYFLLPFFYLWKWVGFGSILYLAAIMGIDQECYEAAIMDGATIFQKIYYITLPLLMPTMVILVLLALGRVMRGEFEMFYQLIGNNAMLLDSTDIVDTLVFRSLVGMPDFGLASSAGFYQSVLCFVIILAANGAVKLYNKDYSLF